jgi:hypothetical protein
LYFDEVVECGVLTNSHELRVLIAKANRLRCADFGNGLLGLFIESDELAFYVVPERTQQATTEHTGFHAENNDQQLEPEEAAAKAALLAECEQLAAAGVTFVAVAFDGSGDDGATEDVRCYDSEDYDHERKLVKHDASRLQDYFDALVPFGYEIDCGGFGDVVLDVKARKIRVEHSERVEYCTRTTYEI